MDIFFSMSVCVCVCNSGQLEDPCVHLSSHDRNVSTMKLFVCVVGLGGGVVEGRSLAALYACTRSQVILEAIDFMAPVAFFFFLFFHNYRIKLAITGCFCSFPPAGCLR